MPLFYHILSIPAKLLTCLNAYPPQRIGHLGGLHWASVQRPRAKALDGSGLTSFSRQPYGRPTYLLYSPASRVGFSELFGGCFDGPLQPCFALLCHEGAPSPRPAR